MGTEVAAGPAGPAAPAAPAVPAAHASPAAGFRRARTDAQREERRAAILATAASMLVHTSVGELSLNALAREVGLAKSNVLRYFGSREAVLLELYDRETRAWLDALEARLDRDEDTDAPGANPDYDVREAMLDAAVPAVRRAADRGARAADAGGSVDPKRAAVSSGDADIEAVARAIADTAAERPVFCDLCASSAGVLERNVSAEVAANYKRAALANAVRLGEIVSSRVAGLRDPSLMALAGGINLIVGGVWTMTQPSIGMAAAYAANPELAEMRHELDSAVGELVATLLVGLRHRRTWGSDRE